MEHEDQFPVPGLSGRFWLSQRTSGGPRRNDEDARSICAPMLPLIG